MLRLRPRRRVRPSAFVRGETGIAAIEFALFAPFLIALFFGAAEFVNALDHRRKVNQVARTIADLTAQGDVQNPMSSSLMQDVFASSKPIMAPYVTALQDVKVSAIGIYVGKLTQPYVCSSWSTGSGARAVGFTNQLSVPDNFERIGARYMVAEITTPYKPLFGQLTSKFVKGLNLSLTWTEIVSWPVRGGVSYSAANDAEVVLPGGKACP